MIFCAVGWISRRSPGASSPRDTPSQVTCDGVSLGELAPGDRLEIHPTAQKITLLHPNKFEYYRLLRSKLHWGRGGFNQSE